jgi:oxygen-independent coproporphyrinogen-3 oxidase
MITALKRTVVPGDKASKNWVNHRENTSRFESYSYAYPHKTAYRFFEKPRSLKEIWKDEDRSALFLYAHIPFCEMRCGFCNLFTRVNHDDDAVVAYLGALARQIEATREALGPASFSRVALGGGTPTHMSDAQFERLLSLMDDACGGVLKALPFLIETSPNTATDAKLDLLAAMGTDRVSIGIQSFDDGDLKSLGRPSTAQSAKDALERIKKRAFPILNVDLIYGMGGQEPADFVAQIQSALHFEPEEVFLYPLYVRPLTGLGRQGRSWDDVRLDAYRAGRDFLLEKGYHQFSMRLFRRQDAPRIEGPAYACQADGMVGLGCGARSYTRGLHYSDEWAVSRGEVRGIIDAWSTRSLEDFSSIRHGFDLNRDEAMVRWILQSLLNADGLDRALYERRFGEDVFSTLPQLFQLEADGLFSQTAPVVRLSQRGCEFSDTIGPFLWSAEVSRLMRGHELR